jgi:precorrin-2/cobalt-factor-2 C20-methyltransferase
MGRLFVVGLGPGDPELVTVRAANILSQVPLIFVPYSTGTSRSLALGIVKRYASPRAEVIGLGFPMSKDVPAEALANLGSRICSELGKHGVGAFAVLGDPSLYSTFTRVSGYVNCAEFEYVPGVSSITACASKARISLGIGDEAIAIIPSSRLELIKKAKDLFETIVVIKGSENLDEASKVLGDGDVIYARRCFLEGEKVIPWNPGEYDRDYFSMLIARHEFTRQQRNPST